MKNLDRVKKKICDAVNGLSADEIAGDETYGEFCDSFSEEFCCKEWGFECKHLVDADTGITECWKCLMAWINKESGVVENESDS